MSKDWEVLVHALMHSGCALYVIETLFVFIISSPYLKRRLDMAECGCERSPTGKCVGWCQATFICANFKVVVSGIGGRIPRVR